jgi:uncharacterized protein YkwD
MKKFLVVLAVFVSGLAFGQRAITKWDTWQLIEMARMDSIWIVAHPINELKLKQAILLELNKRRKENNCLPVKLSTDVENKLAENWSKFQSDNYIVGHDTAYIAKWKQNNTRGEVCVGSIYSEGDWYDSNGLISYSIETKFAKLIIDTWMNSEGHRKCIMKQDIKSVAIGSYFAKPNSKYALSWNCTLRVF